MYAATNEEHSPSCDAAFELLTASPWPQPSRCRATHGRSQTALVNPQHSEAQSVSVVHAFVSVTVPWRAFRRPLRWRDI